MTTSNLRFSRARIFIFSVFYMLLGSIGMLYVTALYFEATLQEQSSSAIQHVILVSEAEEANQLATTREDINGFQVTFSKGNPRHHGQVSTKCLTQFSSYGITNFTTLCSVYTSHHSRIRRIHVESELQLSILPVLLSIFVLICGSVILHGILLLFDRHTKIISRTSLSKDLREFLLKEHVASSKQQHAFQTATKLVSLNQTRREAIYASVDAGVILLDTAGNALEWNSQAEESIHPVVLEVGMPVQQLLYLADDELLENPNSTQPKVALLRTSNIPVTISYRLKKTATSEYVFVFKTIAQSANSDDDAQSVLKIATRGLAHDIRNIQMISSSRILSLQSSQITLTPETLYYNLESLLDESSRITKLLEKFGDLQPSTVTESCKVNDVLRSVTETSFHNSQVEVVLQCAESLPEARISEAALHQVLSNLCLNAKAEMTADGTVVIAAEYCTRSACIMISVEDSGRGISVENVEKVFEPTFTTKELGTGLGLANCRSILSQNNGRIYVDSASGALGGAKFVIKLSAKAPAQCVEDALTPTAPSSDAVFMQRHEKILIIDDDSQAFAATSSILQLIGFTAEHCSSVSQAEHFYSSGRLAEYSVLLVDIYFNHQPDGLRILEKLQNTPELNKVIVLSGADFDAEKYALDPRQFLSKPYGISALNTSLKHILSDNE